MTRFLFSDSLLGQHVIPANAGIHPSHQLMVSSVMFNRYQVNGVTDCGKIFITQGFVFTIRSSGFPPSRE